LFAFAPVEKTIIPEVVPVLDPLTVQFCTVLFEAPAMKRTVAALAAVLVLSIVSAFPPEFSPSITTPEAPFRSMSGPPIDPEIVRAAPPAGEIVTPLYDRAAGSAGVQHRGPPLGRIAADIDRDDALVVPVVDVSERRAERGVPRRADQATGGFELDGAAGQGLAGPRGGRGLPRGQTERQDDGEKKAERRDTGRSHVKILSGGIEEIHCQPS
jgi:hypothetical protein